MTSKPRTYTATEVMEVMARQAEAQTETTSNLISSLIGVVLARLGAVEIAISAADIAECARLYHVEVAPDAAPRSYTYRLKKVALEDTETLDLSL